MLGSCPSVGGVAGTAQGAPRDRCYSPSFPSKWLHWSPPSHSGETDLARGREREASASRNVEGEEGPSPGMGGCWAPCWGFSFCVLCTATPTVGVFLGHSPAVVRKL